MSERPHEIALSEFKPDPMLRRPDNTPECAKFPVIDAHNHLFGEVTPSELVAVMDGVGISIFVNVSANAILPYQDNCYTIERRDFSEYAGRYMRAYPGRFAGLTMADFAQWGDPVLLRDDAFADQCIQQLEADVGQGALGLKVTKELGLYFRDRSGAMIAIDDERLSPVWHRAGELGVPVLMHTADPWAFFLPVDAHNEHYPTLREFPAWSFADSHFTMRELLDQRNRMIAAHPRTLFILPHIASNPECLDEVSRLLDTYSNVCIDLSARIDELGRQPYTARDFLIHYRDRILFGVDMPIRADIYRSHFRFLETRDEYFEYPDYIGRWSKSRWRISGLYLPNDVLKLIYRENAIRLMPSLE